MEEWDDLTKEFSMALVGFVFGTTPNLSRMRGYARLKWGDASRVSVSQLNNGIFLFRFKEEDHMLRVLSGGPWSFDNRPLILKPWSEDEKYKCGSIDALPVWIRLPGLKAHLCGASSLSRLCSQLGKPICTDGVTAEGSFMSYARVCVEIFADHEFREVIRYKDPYGNSFTQPVVYEWKPLRCTNCLNFGHLSNKCPEPNMEKMLDELRKHEAFLAKQQDKRDLVEEEGDIDEFHLVAGGVSPDEEGDESAIVPETLDAEGDGVSSRGHAGKGMDDQIAQANLDREGDCRNLVKEGMSGGTNDEFKKVMSKSSQKRARKKERQREKGESSR
ncbi:unnamed protein product [Rhodiola kirilowii]